MALLEIDSLTKDFPGVRALDGVGLRVEAGEIHALCGENGAGKSTLLKILSGIYGHGSFDGEIRWKGSPLVLETPRQASGAGIALVAQELNLVPGMSLAENLFLGRELRQGWNLDKIAMRREASAALDRIGLGHEDPLALAESLSVGRRQLLEIAKALQQNAQLLILDEPTAALTDADAARLLDLVAQIAAGGTAVLYVSHRLEEIFKIAHRITVIRDGKSVRTADARDWTQDSVIAAMVGREDALSATPLPAGHGEGRGVVLELKHWSVAKPGQADKAALQDVHLSLRQGEILGLGGLMGSGRSALLSTLFGDWKGQGSGELSLFGVPQEPFRSPAQAIAQGLCLAGEDRKRQGLIGSASVLENITLASLARYSRRGLLDWPGLRAAAERTQDELRIKAPALDAEVLTLSGGNQQKVVLGRWMLIQPKILLLDEPTRGIDVSAKAEIHRLIRVLASQGLSVIVASSDLPELLSLSHRIVVFSQGRVAGELDQASFSPERVMRLATAA